jgi:hypothetical protein
MKDVKIGLSSQSDQRDEGERATTQSELFMEMPVVTRSTHRDFAHVPLWHRRIVNRREAITRAARRRAVHASVFRARNL